MTPALQRSRRATIGLLLAPALGCHKNTPDTPTPAAATGCRVNRVSFSSGEYELYSYNAAGFLTSVALYYKNQAGQVPTSVTASKLSYNAQGLLDRVSWGSGADYEQYSWTNGALTQIEAFVGGQLVYRVGVTTDANQRITALKSTNVTHDPAYGFDYTTSFSLDAQGHYTNLVATGPDGVFFTGEYSAFDATTQSPYGVFKGVPVFVGTFLTEVGTTPPIHAYVNTKVVYQYGYDNKGNYTGLQPVSDLTLSYQANAAHFPLSAQIKNAVSNITSTTTYQYSNCD